MANAPEHPTDESLPPGVIEVIMTPGGPTLVKLTAEEWERRTGMGNHVSFGAPMPVPPVHPGTGGGSVGGVSSLPRQGVF